ncbi:MAG: fructose-1,6-bisphosphate aldolase/phosphatase [Candidatus Micrarchaeota archaeon]
MKVTLSIIKADVGSYCGHQVCHPALMEIAREMLGKAKKSGRIIDYYVANCGDDMDLIITSDKGADNKEVHGLAWEVFTEATKKAKALKLYGAGQDLLSDAFSGNVKGLGPGVAEMEFEERKAEPVMCFLMDKTEPGAFNFPVFRMFADPFNTAGLVIDPNMQGGFSFEVYDVLGHKKVLMKTPEELYSLLALIGAKSRYVIKRVFPGEGNKVASSEPAAVVSTEKLYQIAGEYVGKDDPVAIVRAQSGLPAVGEIVEPFAFPHLVSGWMRGSHNGPIMPVGMKDAVCTRFDGPPRVVALGFQLNNGELVGPVDAFADIAFDRARQGALRIADYMRRHGPFEPHRLSPEDMEYTTLPKVLKKLEGRFKGL